MPTNALSVEYPKPENAYATSQASVAACLFSVLGAPCFINCKAYLEAERIAAIQAQTRKTAFPTNAVSTDCLREENRRLSLVTQSNNPVKKEE